MNLSSETAVFSVSPLLCQRNPREKAKYNQSISFAKIMWQKSIIPLLLPYPIALQGISAFIIRNILKLLCRAPQHCGVFCHAKYRGGVRRTEGLQKWKQDGKRFPQPRHRFDRAMHYHKSQKESREATLKTKNARRYVPHLCSRSGFPDRSIAIHNLPAKW